MKLTKARFIPWALLFLVLITGEKSLAEKIIVAGDRNRPPLEYLDAAGTPMGILVDLWKLWSEKTGIPVEFSLEEEWEAFRSVREGRADVLSGAIAGTDITLEYAPPFYHLDAHVFYRREVRLGAPYNLEPYRVGVSADDPAGRYLHLKHPDFSIKTHASFNELIKEIRSENLNVFVANPVEALFNMGSSGVLEDFRQSGEPLYSVGISFAVRKGNFPLLGVISGGLGKITPVEIAAVEKKYAGTSPGHRNAGFISLAGILFSMALGTAAAFWVFRELLKKGVARKTDSLRKSHQLLLEFNEELKERESRHRALSEGSVHGVFIVENRVILEGNRAGAEMFGMGTEEMIGTPLGDLIAPDHRHKAHLILGEGPDRVFTLMGSGKDRAAFPLELRAKGVKFRGRDLTALSLTDLTLPILAEERRNSARRRHASLMESIGEAAFVVDRGSGRILLTNTAFTGKTGYPGDEAEGRCIDDLKLFKGIVLSRDLYTVAREKGDLAGLEATLLTAEAREIPVLVSVRPARFEAAECLLVIARDLTPMRTASPETHVFEKQLHTVRAISSMDGMVGGFAERLDALFLEILGNTGSLQLKTDPGHDNRKNLDRIESLSGAGIRIATRLRALARERLMEQVPTDLNELVKSQTALFERSHGHIKYFDRYEKSPWPVGVNRERMEEALFDILLNAVWAMPGGGNLEVRTRNVTLSELFTEQFGAMPGRYVKISVEDSGMGMDSRKQSLLPSPFYTSRALGRGPGMGLAYARGIVGNHGGALMVRSEMDAGTRVNVYLPAAADRSLPLPLGPLSLLPGRETVLLIEEDPGARNMGSKLIASLGYNAVAQADGTNGIRRYSGHAPRIDLVIHGMALPDMTGEEVSDRLRKINADVKSMVSISHNVDHRVEALLSSGCRDFVRRPFSGKELSRKIRKVLDAS